MIIETPDFQADKIISACHIICNDEILLLLRNNNKPQGNTYGVPAGKAQENENPRDTVIREIKEETGIEVIGNELEFQQIFNVKYREYNFEFHLFHLYLTTKPTVIINKEEHTKYIWISPTDALELPLIEDEDNVLKEIFNIS